MASTQGNDRTRQNLMIGGLVVVGLIAAWAVLSPDDDAALTDEPPAEAPPDEATEAPADEPEQYDHADAAARARINAALARLEEQAEARDDSWMPFERLAGGYMERQRLTGDWEDFARAEAALERGFERAPDGSGPLLMRAQLNYTLHRLDQIEPDLQAVEGFAVPQAELLHAVRVMRANVALQRGQYDEARDAFDALLEEDRSREPLVGAAGHRMAVGQYEEADALLAEAEELAVGADPMARAWLCLVRGLVDLEQEAYADAIEDWDRGLEHMPGWYLIEEHIAEGKAGLGQTDEAIADYEALIERTNDPEFMDAIAPLYEARGDDEQAEEMRRRAHAGHEARIEAFPTAAFGHALDHFLEHEGDAERAVELAEANRDVRPNGEAWTKLAAAYLNVGRVADAREALATVEAMPYRSGELDEVREAVQAAEEPSAEEGAAD